MTQFGLGFDNPHATQANRILSYLEQGHSLTPLEAFERFQCLRLGGRIYDLKKAGYDIKDEWVQVNSGKRVKRYFL